MCYIGLNKDQGLFPHLAIQVHPFDVPAPVRSGWTEARHVDHAVDRKSHRKRSRRAAARLLATPGDEAVHWQWVCLLVQD